MCTHVYNTAQQQQQLAMRVNVKKQSVWDLKSGIANEQTFYKMHETMMKNEPFGREGPRQIKNVQEKWVARVKMKFDYREKSFFSLWQAKHIQHMHEKLEFACKHLEIHLQRLT